MEHQVYSKNVIVTDSLQEYLASRLAHFDKLAESVTSCRVDISRDQHHRKGEVFRVEINLNVPGTLLRSVEVNADARAAIDLASDTLLRQLRKYKSKRNDSQRRLKTAFKNIFRRKS